MWGSSSKEVAEVLEVDVERPASALTHQGASEVFELAESQPVRIKRRGDAPDEVLLSYDQFAATVRFSARLVLLARALAKGAEQAPDLEGMHWTKLFSVAERRRMLGELLEAARAAIERGNPSIFNAVWKGWAESAELMGDPEAMARLTAPVESGLAPLPRP